MESRGILVWALQVAVVVSGCGAVATNDKSDPQPEEMPLASLAGGGPLVLEGVDDPALVEFFAKRVNVFGVDVVATAVTSDDKVLHAANVMAQYLDNDEDGIIDNPALVDTMIEQKALLIMFADFDELENSGLRGSPLRDQYRMQDCEGHETNPEEGFDASLEEVLHLISATGYSELYPDVFGEGAGTELAAAMDLARGGQFETIPDPYPDGAWYTYDDETCEYECMAGEYFYWALTSILGAQADPERCDQISNEWRPCTTERVASMDPAVYALMTNPEYKMPTVLPDGKYRP